MPGGELRTVIARYERMPRWEVDAELRRNRIDPRRTVTFVDTLIRRTAEAWRERGLLHVRRLLVHWEIRPRSSA